MINRYTFQTQIYRETLRKIHRKYEDYYLPIPVNGTKCKFFKLLISIALPP